MQTTGKRRKDAVGRPAEFAHADFGGIVGARNPFFEVIERFVVSGIGNGERCQQVMELAGTERLEGGVIFAFRSCFDCGDRRQESLLNSVSIGAEQKIDERGRLRFAGAWDNSFGKEVERGELLCRQEKWFACFGGKM